MGRDRPRATLLMNELQGPRDDGGRWGGEAAGGTTANAQPPHWPRGKRASAGRRAEFWTTAPTKVGEHIVFCLD